jgi:bifunctional polynucleotide phosphatase/kinase
LRSKHRQAEPPIENATDLIPTHPLKPDEPLKDRVYAIDSLTYYLSLFTDNTNADQETRALWLDVAKEFKVPIRCVYFSATPAICKHNNAVRAANKTLVSHLKAAGLAFLIC